MARGARIRKGRNWSNVRGDIDWARSNGMVHTYLSRVQKWFNTTCMRRPLKKLISITLTEAYRLSWGNEFIGSWKMHKYSWRWIRKVAIGKSKLTTSRERTQHQPLIILYVGLMNVVWFEERESYDPKRDWCSVINGQVTVHYWKLGEFSYIL